MTKKTKSARREIEDEAGDPMAAAARAFDWVQVSLGSVDAHGALADSAFQAGLVALGTESALKLEAMDGISDTGLPDVDTPFGPMSATEAVLCDVSRLLLMDGRYSAG
jgi:hypothetical protein